MKETAQQQIVAGLVQPPHQGMLLALLSWVQSKQQERNDLQPPRKCRIAVLGAGCGALPNALLDLDLGVEPHVHAVEIDSSVIKIGEEFFGFSKREDLEIVCGDAVEYIENSATNTFSVVFLDVANLDDENQLAAPPVRFCNQHFIQQLHGTMIMGGLLAINVVGGISKLLEVYVRYRKCFKEVWALRLPSQTILYAQKGRATPRRMWDVVGELSGHTVRIVGSTLQQIQMYKSSTGDDMGWLSCSRLDNLVATLVPEKIIV